MPLQGTASEARANDLIETLSAEVFQQLWHCCVRDRMSKARPHTALAGQL